MLIQAMAAYVVLFRQEYNLVMKYIFGNLSLEVHIFKSVIWFDQESIFLKKVSILFGKFWL